MPLTSNPVDKNTKTIRARFETSQSKPAPTEVVAQLN